MGIVPLQERSLRFAHTLRKFTSKNQKPQPTRSNIYIIYNIYIYHINICNDWKVSNTNRPSFSFDADRSSSIARSRGPQNELLSWSAWQNWKRTFSKSDGYPAWQCMIGGEIWSPWRSFFSCLHLRHLACFRSWMYSLPQSTTRVHTLVNNPCHQHYNSNICWVNKPSWQLSRIFVVLVEPCNIIAYISVWKPPCSMVVAKAGGARSQK